MVYFSKGGSILIAIVFVLVLSITAVSFIAMISGRATLTANQLKRPQAINCAEAALYETFNRIRASGGVPPTGWVNPTSININVADPYTPGGTYTIAVNVTIVGSSAPYTVEATVSYDDVRM